MKQSILLVLCLSMAALFSSATAKTMNVQEDQIKDPELPACCTRSKTVTTAVKCEFDGFCQEYHPVAAAEAVSRISSITDLTFQINIAFKKQVPVTDADLQKIADRQPAPQPPYQALSRWRKAAHRIASRSSDGFCGK